MVPSAWRSSGAGFIGVEVTATCRSLGLEVAIVEAVRVPLSAALGSELGAVCAGMYATSGVALYTGTTAVVECLTAPDGTGRRRVTGLVLSDGQRLRADVVAFGTSASSTPSFLSRRWPWDVDIRRARLPRQSGVQRGGAAPGGGDCAGALTCMP